jgi:hypothetical protein
MAQATAILVRTTGDVETVRLPDENAHHVIHEAVGGWFDCVYDGGDVVYYVHDEGLLIDLDPNIPVSVMTSRPIAGDVLIVGALDANGVQDGENYDVPARFLSPEFAQAVRSSSASEPAKIVWREEKERVLARGPIILPWDL